VTASRPLSARLPSPLSGLAALAGPAAGLARQGVQAAGGSAGEAVRTAVVSAGGLAAAAIGAAAGAVADAAQAAVGTAEAMGTTARPMGEAARSVAEAARSVAAQAAAASPAQALAQAGGVAGAAARQFAQGLGDLVSGAWPATVGELAGISGEGGVGRLAAGAGALASSAWSAAMSELDEISRRGAAAAANLADLGPRRQRRRVWAHRGHAAIEMRGLSGGRAKRQRLAKGAQARLQALRGVRWAEVNAVTAQVLIAFDEGSVSLERLVDAVEGVEEAHGARDDDFSWSQPEHPSDDTPFTATCAALAADLIGVAFGVTGRVARLPRPHPVARVPLAVIENYPRLRDELEKHIGPMGADVLLALGNAAVFGACDGPAKPALDAFYRLLLVGELRARASVWQRRAAELCFEATRVSDDVPPARSSRPAPLPAGPIEAYADRAAVGSLLAAAGVLAATRNAGRAADALLAGIPSAARLSREGFAAALGRDLARRGVIPMDRAALRRLDRVTAVVIDSPALCTVTPRVLSATAGGSTGNGGAGNRGAGNGGAGNGGAGNGEAALWRAADAVLRRQSLDALRGPGPWRDGRHRLTRMAASAPGRTERPEAPGGETSAGSEGTAAPGGAPRAVPRPAPGGVTVEGADGLTGSAPLTGPGRSVPGSGAAMDSPDSPEGMRLRVTTLDGQELGEVTAGCEVDPLAEAVLAAARAGGARLLLSRHASTRELTGLVDEVVEGDLAERVRALQTSGEGVLLLSADDGGALAVADVSVGYLRPAGRVCWTADLICGPGLGDVWRLLEAAGRARAVSEQGVALAVSGSALGALLAAVGRRPSPGGDLLRPVQAAGLLGLAWGAYTAKVVTRQALPRPAPRTAWHALEPGDVLARLATATGDGQRSAGDPDGAAAAWARRWQERLAATPAAPALLPLRGGAQLVSATVGELKDPLTPVLLVGAAASALLGSGVDSALVGGVMVGNAVVGGVQRLRTERALHELLLREQQPGRRVRWAPGGPVPSRPEDPGLPADLVPASDLRPGDLIVLRPDDVVPADARLVSADALEMDESTLTGESLPVRKDPAATVAPALAERTSMVYEGTTVLAGAALAVVVAVGDTTEAGRASAAARGAKPAVGVQARLGELTRIALPVTGLGGLAVTGLSMLRGAALREALAAGVTVAVAAVPEGLPLVATVAQLSAARRLSARGVLVRSTRTLEALGRVDVLCFDKTGTLTKGRLEVARTATLDGEEEPGGERGRRLLTVAARACPVPGQARITHATDQAILGAAPWVTGKDGNGAAGVQEDGRPTGAGDGRPTGAGDGRPTDAGDGRPTGAGDGRPTGAGDGRPTGAGDGAWELLDELPFQNDRGYSASLGRENGRLLLAVKGAPEVLLRACSHVLDGGQPGGGQPGSGRPGGSEPGGNEHGGNEPGGGQDEAGGHDGGTQDGGVRDGGGRPGRALPLTSARRRAARAVVDRLAAEGLRVLAVAERSPAGPAADDPPSSSKGAPGSGAPGNGVPGNDSPTQELVTGLTLLGFVAIADAIRPDAATVIADLTRAGIRSVMITGDHPATASAIARRAGIADSAEVVTGAELDRLPESQRLTRVNSTAVFARVSPEQKVRIVADLRRNGHVVAMTGDGTNDAAAIRLADVGIGVAARGSTAARSASDLVLPGSDIARLADALREGRALWSSVRDAVSILVGGNAGEVAFMLLGTALGGRSPLNTRQLLLVNMLTDMFPALAVALGTTDGSRELAAGPATSLLGAPLARAMMVRGGATALGATVAWGGGRLTGRTRRASTMGLAALVSTQLGQTLLANSRSPVVIVTCAASAAALVLIVNTPGVSHFFGCTPLGPVAWGIVAGSSAAATAASALAPRLLSARDEPS
jgi:cation-transporting P-type ATPase I